MAKSTTQRKRITQHAAKRTRSRPPEPVPRRHLYVPVLLGLILLCGLGFRIYGLSHGLAEGEVYHPDTPHVLSATQHFLEGTYFFRINNPDYDGYPYFYSHLIEYLWRGVRGIRCLFSRVLLGVEHTGESPTPAQLRIALFWLARLTNVILSTLTIFIVFRIAVRTLDSTAGLIGVALLAISPMNMATAHYAGSDTAVVFFTTLTLLFALRICDAGLWRDYLFAGALIACSFSAKYHGGIVALTCLLAHILRWWPPKRIMGKEPLSRIALLALAFFVVVLLANPGFLVSPGKAFHDFREYCKYIPTAKLTPEQLDLGFFGKAWLSLTLNLPVLLRSMGAFLSVIALAGLIHAFFRKRKLVVLASFPLLYLLFTFLSKPIQQRFYLAVLLPTMFLLGAAFLVKISQIRKIKAATATAAVAVLLLGFHYLVRASLTEGYFFAHRDTRKCAKLWAKENIPPCYRIKSGPYTFTPDRPLQPPYDYKSTVFLKSSLREVPLPENAFLLKAFDLEKDALPKFRNPRIEVHVEDSSLISEGFSLPVYQRIPSEARNEFIFADGAAFYRDEKMVEFGVDKTVTRTLVSPKPLDSALVVVKNGSLFGAARIRLGGLRTTFVLDPCEVKWKEFKGLRRSFPSSESRYVYRLSAGGTIHGAVLVVALTPEEKGVALYNIGEYAAAHPFLALASRKSNSPALAAMAYIGARLSMSPLDAEEEKALLAKASPLAGELTPEAIRSAFGLSLEYLDPLPYLSFKPYKNSTEGFHTVADDSASADSAATLDTEPRKVATWYTSTPPLILEPGCYRATLRLRGGPFPDNEPTVKVRLVERRMKVILAEKEFPVQAIPEAYTNLHFPFVKPKEVGECWVLVSTDQYVSLFIDRIEIRPDPVRTLAALRAILKLASSAPESLPTVAPLDYKPLLRLGQQHLVENRGREALQHYFLAHELRPDLAEPIRRMRRIQDMGVSLPPEDSSKLESILVGVESQRNAVEIGETRVAFENGIKLTGYAMTRSPLHPGDTLGLALRWSLPSGKPVPKDLIVWVHLLDKDGGKVLQLDHYLSEDLAFPQKPERTSPILNCEQEIPLLTPPGKYRIEVGLWIPLRDWRPRIVDTALPHARDSVTLREISIEPR